MTEAVAVRRDGDRFQARIFWKYAADMLAADASPIVRVGFERGPKGFDDVWVEYDPGRAPGDGRGGRLHRLHVQCKWHSAPSTYTHAELVDPDFINATSRSLLQRALDAQRLHAPHGQGAVFQLTTNWQIKRDDALSPLINTRFGGLRVDQLFEGKTTRSATGRVRDLWRTHLGIDEDELRLLVGTLRFAPTPETLTGITEQLNRDLRYAGLKPVPAERSGFLYDEVIFGWLGEGPVHFDRPSLLEACRREDLIQDKAPQAKTFGVKSFVHPIDRLEHRCVRVLDLVPEFGERFIHDESGWASSLYPKLKDFLLDAAGESERIRLTLDAHATLAFAAGSVLNTKCGRVVELEQRSPAYQIWTPDDQTVDAVWPGLELEVHPTDTDGDDIAIAVGLTHDVLAQVQRYVNSHLPQVRILVAGTPQGGAGPRVVRCGAHADQLATQVCNELRTYGGSPGRFVHLFVAAPNAFTFMLGQRQSLMGRVRLYEFDFEGQRTGSYEPSLDLPVTQKT